MVLLSGSVTTTRACGVRGARDARRALRPLHAETSQTSRSLRATRAPSCCRSSIAQSRAPLPPAPPLWREPCSAARRRRRRPRPLQRPLPRRLERGRQQVWQQRRTQALPRGPRAERLSAGHRVPPQRRPAAHQAVRPRRRPRRAGPGRRCSAALSAVLVPQPVLVQPLAQPPAQV